MTVTTAPTETKPTSNVEKAIAQYRKIDAKITEMNEEHKQRIAPLVTQMERLEGMLKQYLEANGFENVKTASGMAVLVNTRKPQVKDWAAFLAWAVENKRYDLLQKRLLDKQYLDDIDGGAEEPPGTMLETGSRLSIRAPTKK